MYVYSNEHLEGNKYMYSNKYKYGNKHIIGQVINICMYIVYKLTGVQTMISGPSSQALHCSHILPPPYAHTTLMLYTLPNFFASW